MRRPSVHSLARPTSIIPTFRRRFCTSSNKLFQRTRKAPFRYANIGNRWKGAFWKLFQPTWDGQPACIHIIVVAGWLQFLALPATRTSKENHWPTTPTSPRRTLGTRDRPRAGEERQGPVHSPGAESLRGVRVSFGGSGNDVPPSLMRRANLSWKCLYVEISFFVRKCRAASASQYCRDISPRPFGKTFELPSSQNLASRRNFSASLVCFYVQKPVVLSLQSFYR